MSSSRGWSMDESLRTAVALVSLELSKHLASGLGEAKLFRHAVEKGVSQRSINEPGGGGLKSSRVDREEHSSQEESDVTVVTSQSVDRAREIRNCWRTESSSSSDELTDRHDNGGGMSKRESAESNESIR